MVSRYVKKLRELDKARDEKQQPSSGPHRWKPGESGNPKGRPPGIDARDLARTHTEAAIVTLVHALRDKRLCVAAACALLDRGWGKPREQIEQANLHLHLGGIDGPPLPETLEQWLQRRRSELDLRLEPPAGEAD
jgi:hypothetical protein